MEFYGSVDLGQGWEREKKKDSLYILVYAGPHFSVLCRKSEAALECWLPTPTQHSVPRLPTFKAELGIVGNAPLLYYWSFFPIALLLLMFFEPSGSCFCVFPRVFGCPQGGDSLPGWAYSINAGARIGVGILDILAH